MSRRAAGGSEARTGPVPVIAPAHGQRHSNCWVPLNVREEPRLGSAVVGQLQWGDVVTVLQRAEEEVSVDLDFGSSFNAKSGRLELPVYTLRCAFCEGGIRGGRRVCFRRAPERTFAV